MRGAVLVVLSWVPPYWPFPHLVVLSSAAPGGFWPPGWHETPPQGWDAAGIRALHGAG